MKLSILSFLSLLTQVPLTAAEPHATPGPSPALNGLSFRSLVGGWEGEPSGTLLESLSGVTATGKGVIVGIIDTGIDWRHPDFRDPADSLRSRIISIWDRSEDREWTGDEIEAALRGEAGGPPRDPSGHGTHVAGIAAGNGNADRRYRGMAPESEIVVVISGGVLEGVRYIFDLAEKRGLPAVVNFSRRHPLVVSERKGLESLLREQTGRALVASAGNRGQGLRHARFELTEAASYTIFRTSQTEESGSILGFEAYHQGPGEAWVGAGLSEDEMVWRSLEEIARGDGWVNDSLGTAVINWLGRFDEKDFLLEFYIVDSNPELAEWRVAARGSGVFHTWVWAGEPRDEPVQEPLDDPHYRPRDNYYTVSPNSTSPEVIAVGAFANRDLADLPVGNLLPSSSRGPSPKGLLKPDLAAPGALTAAWSGDSTNYRTLKGTSMAAPVVAGAVALYFERFPQATNRDVWRALTESAASDEFTGETPNFDWGYGKLDVAAFLQEPPTAVAAEPGDALPSGFSLAQNHPNPFNGRTTIAYELAEHGSVELILYDLLGQPVRRLVSEYQGAGPHRVAWDGTDDEGNPVASGVYLYRLKAGNLQRALRLVLVR